MCFKCVLVLCVSSRNPVPSASKSMAFLGAHDLQEASAYYKGIEYFMIHPNYQRWNGGYKHDIALVRLKTKVGNMVKPVKLPSSTDTFGPSSECFITGWGNVDKGGMSKKLQTESSKF